MLAHDFPDCVHCGASSRALRPGSGRFSPSSMDQTMWCTCGALFHMYGSHRYGLVTQIATAQLRRDDVGGVHLPNVYVDWLDDVVLPTWRARRERGSSMVLPPRAPHALAVFVVGADQHEKRRWVRIEGVLQKASDVLEVPEDPILVRNRAFFDDLFMSLPVAVSPRFVENRYHRPGTKGVPPWAQFDVGDLEFTVGWRKRVIAIQVQSPRDFPMEAIRDAAHTDRTTFVTDKEDPRTDPGLHALEVHAWGADKAVEYLTLLLETAAAVEA